MKTAFQQPAKHPLYQTVKAAESLWRQVVLSHPQQSHQQWVEEFDKTITPLEIMEIELPNGARGGAGYNTVTGQSKIGVSSKVPEGEKRAITAHELVHIAQTFFEPLRVRAETYEAKQPIRQLMYDLSKPVTDRLQAIRAYLGTLPCERLKALKLDFLMEIQAHRLTQKHAEALSLDIPEAHADHKYIRTYKDFNHMIRTIERQRFTEAVKNADNPFAGAVGRQY